MLLNSYQSQLPTEGFPVIRDIRSTGTYLTRRSPVKGLICCKRTSKEQALNQLHLSRVIRPRSAFRNREHKYIQRKCDLWLTEKVT